MCFDGHILTAGSRTQKSIALSSVESEFNALVSTSCKCLYLRSNLRFVMPDNSLHVQLLSDSSAARGVLGRQGSGRIKHLEGKHLWAQAKVRDRELSCGAVGTKFNVADLFRKGLTRPRIGFLLYYLGVHDEEGLPIGQAEFEGEQQRTQFRAVVRRIRMSAVLVQHQA